MSIHFIAVCDGCDASVRLINKSLSEAPEGWIVFTLNSVTLHACSHTCAEKAALKAIAPLKSKTA